jgi:ankyrin repeat protein
MLASDGGYTEIVKLLLDKGADVNEMNNTITNSLILASNRGYTEIVKLLLSNGANVNLTNKDKDSPLILASENGYVDIVKLLLSKRADVNHKDIFKRSSLMVAYFREHMDILKLLLENGANPNDQYKPNNYTSYTMLFDACKKGNMPVIKLLLSYGADPNITDNNGQKPIDVFRGTPEEKKQIEDLMKQYTITFAYKALGGLNDKGNPFGWPAGEATLLTDLKEYMGGKKRKKSKKTKKNKSKKSKNLRK